MVGGTPLTPLRPRVCPGRAGRWPRGKSRSVFRRPAICFKLIDGPPIEPTAIHVAPPSPRGHHPKRMTELSGISERNATDSVPIRAKKRKQELSSESFSARSSTVDLGPGSRRGAASGRASSCPSGGISRAAALRPEATAASVWSEGGGRLADGRPQVRRGAGRRRAWRRSVHDDRHPGRAPGRTRRPRSGDIWPIPQLRPRAWPRRALCASFRGSARHDGSRQGTAERGGPVKARHHGCAHPPISTSPSSIKLSAVATIASSLVRGDHPRRRLALALLEAR